MMNWLFEQLAWLVGEVMAAVQWIFWLALEPMLWLVLQGALIFLEVIRAIVGPILDDLITRAGLPATLAGFSSILGSVRHFVELFMPWSYFVTGLSIVLIALFAVLMWKLLWWAIEFVKKAIDWIIWIANLIAKLVMLLA